VVARYGALSLPGGYRRPIACPFAHGRRRWGTSPATGWCRPRSKRRHQRPRAVGRCRRQPRHRGSGGSP